MEIIKKLLNKYATFIKYVFSAGISFIIDLTLFTIFTHIFKGLLNGAETSILYGTVLARILSSLVNYSLNRNAVFKKKGDDSKIDKSSFIKYVTLVIIQMFVSSFSVMGIYKATKFNETLIKIPVECVLFVVNFFVQKLFIFPDKKFKMDIPKKVKPIIYLVLSILASFAITVKLNSKGIVWTRRDTDTILQALLTIGIYNFYRAFDSMTIKRGAFNVLAIMFTLLLVFGYSFDTTDSAYLVYGSYQFVLVSLAKFVGLFFFIRLLLNVVYEALVNLKVKNEKGSRLIRLLDSHPFKFTVVALLICYLPYIIAFYPAVMGYDPANQIKEVMGIHNRYMDSVVLLDENVTITSFNPVIHTLFLGNCFKLGVKMGNVNLGLFLYSVIQVSCMILLLAYSIKFLSREGVPNKILLIIIAIYAFVPIFPFYSISTNKDTFFTLFIMLYTIKLYELIKYDYNRKNVIVMIIVSILLFLSRNNGIYTVFLSLPFCLLLKEKRRPILLTMICILVSYISYTKIILPYFKITPTSIREVLSIPFQQTAALIKHDEDIIKKKDKETIAKILDYEVIKTSYDPELADKVKNTFNKDYESEDLKEYFEVWFKYLKKRPLIYVDATVNNMYGYFYPNTVRWYLYHEYNTKLKEAGFDYHYNKLGVVRKFLVGYASAFQYIPLLGVFVNIGFTVWIYMYLFASLIVNKNKKMLLLLLPAFSLILVCIASPANAYFRYALPYIASLPMILALLYQNKKS